MAQSFFIVRIIIIAKAPVPPIFNTPICSHSGFGTMTRSSLDMYNQHLSRHAAPVTTLQQATTITKCICKLQKRLRTELS